MGTQRQWKNERQFFTIGTKGQQEKKELDFEWRVNAGVANRVGGGAEDRESW